MSTTDYKKKMNGLIEILRGEGWRVEPTRPGHVQLIPPDKQYEIVHAPGTSSDHRGFANVLAQLRRSGYQDR
jgi:hypothetical protein